MLEHVPILRDRLFPIQYDFSSPSGVKNVADPYGDTRGKFLNWLSGTPYPGSNGDMGQIGKSGPTYSGEMTAPMSPQEQASLGKVNDFAASDITKNPTYKSANDFTNSFLNDNYDPSTSSAYQAIKATAAQNLGDEKTRIASDAGGGGRYFTGARIKQDQRADTDTTNALNTSLAQLQQQHTAEQLGLIPQAMSMAGMETNQPLQQATALQTLGALPRNLQQNTDNSLINQFYQSQYQYPLSIAQLLAGVQAPPVYQQNGPTASQNATQAGMQVGQAALMAAMMCWVASEVFGGWYHPKTVMARYWVNFKAPKWFKAFYLKYGERIALFIKDKPILKGALRPLFECFAYLGGERV